MLETPLMVSIVTLTFAGHSAAELKRTGSLDERRDRLFGAYVERMFQRKGDSPRYPREQALLWLGWLAEKMQQNDLQLYRIERMQPRWLAKKWQSVLVQYCMSIPTGVLISAPQLFGNITARRGIAAGVMFLSSPLK